ncbi:hypothetical protein [Candidatus Nitrosotalea okcheonensis]|uniref:Uncharacterized protein n=1 Tax=Candidatus Nitrosotalea okcheonensis TaxID=1903276 RepID=A0A2H1FG38_9ARCH|nr:hypothetical protein [Candidatus Nitrosotalea okcheonensis]SMH71730.1 membrane protein of unknown function [Candidatus Nitrosotalea okcheonensis]
MKSHETKAICCLGIFGVTLCTILMTISMGGSFAAAFSKDSNMKEANSMSSMKMNDQKYSNIILSFFGSQWGDALLVVSSASMLLGIWFNGKIKLFQLAVLGIFVMFIGMYSYYSIVLQVIGASIMGLAHLSNYNYKVSKLLRI